MRGGRPRLALLSTNFRGGGVQAMMVRTANRMTALGYPTDLLVFDRKGPLAARCAPEVRVVELEPSSMLRAKVQVARADPAGLATCLRPLLLARRPPHRLPFLGSLARYLRTDRPAGLFAASSGPNLIAVLAKRLAGVPTRIVVSQRDILCPPDEPDMAGRRRELVPALRRAYAMAEARVAVSRELGRVTAAELGLAPGSFEVIYNPVVEPGLQAQAATPPGHPWLEPGEPPAILAVGRIEPQKDYPTLLHAFARLRATRPCRLLILGGAKREPAADPVVAELEALAASLGIADALDLAGFVANPAAFMAHAAMLVLPSRHEGLGNVLIEALAVGCPVVSTDCPHGPREILADGAFGRLAPVGDPVALAHAMAATLEAPPDRARLQARGAEFSVERAVDAYLRLLLPPAREAAG